MVNPLMTQLSLFTGIFVEDCASADLILKAIYPPFFCLKRKFGTPNKSLGFWVQTHFCSADCYLFLGDICKLLHDVVLFETKWVNVFPFLGSFILVLHSEILSLHNPSSLRPSSTRQVPGGLSGWRVRWTDLSLRDGGYLGTQRRFLWRLGENWWKLVKTGENGNISVVSLVMSQGRNWRLPAPTQPQMLWVFWLQLKELEASDAGLLSTERNKWRCHQQEWG